MMFTFGKPKIKEFYLLVHPHHSKNKIPYELVQRYRDAWMKDLNKKSIDKNVFAILMLQNEGRLKKRVETQFEDAVKSYFGKRSLLLEGISDYFHPLYSFSLPNIPEEITVLENATINVRGRNLTAMVSLMQSIAKKYKIPYDNCMIDFSQSYIEEESTEAFSLCVDHADVTKMLLDDFKPQGFF